MQDQLFIDDIEIELYPDTVIALTYQINDLAELKDRQANFSNQFKIPKTKANIAALQWSDQVQSTTDKPYRKLPAKVIKAGIQVVPKGFAIIESTNKEFNVTVYSGNYDFFSAIEKKKINEVDLSSLIHVFNLAEVIASRANASGYKYPIINYGDLVNTNRDVDVRNQRPAIFIDDIISRIFSEAGFVRSGAIWTDPYYTKQLLPYSGQPADERQHILHATKTADQTGDGSGTITRAYFDDDSTPPDNFDPANSWVQDTILNGLNTYIVPYDVAVDKFEITFNVPYKVEYFNTGGGGFPSTMIWTIAIYYFDGATHSLAAFKDIVLARGSSESGTATLTFNHFALNQGDKFYVRIDPDAILTYGTEAAYTLYSGGTVDAYLNGLNFEMPVNLESILPDMTQLDLLRIPANQFAIFFKTDYWTGVVEAVTMNEIIANIPNAKDWSDKLHDDPLTWLLEYRLPRYGQKSYLRYARDSDDIINKLGEGDGYLVCDDETLPTEETLVTIPVAATGEQKLLGDLDIPSIRKIDDDGKFSKSTVQRILVDDTAATLAGNPIAFKDGVTTTNESTDIPLAYFQVDGKANNIGFADDLIPSFYDGVSDMIRHVKKLTALFKLTSNDIAELDHFTPVYLWQFSSYFYINKVISFKGTGLTKVELIRLGGGDVCVPEFGDELIVTTSDFSDPSWYYNYPADWNFTSGAKHNGASTFADILSSEVVSELPDKKYLIEITITEMTQGSVGVSFGDSAMPTITANGNYKFVVTTLTNTDLLNIAVSNDFDGKITFASVKEQLTCL